MIPLIGRSSGSTLGSVFSSLGGSVLNKVATAGLKKVDQFLGLETDTPNPQAISVDYYGNRQGTTEDAMSGSDLPDRLQPNYYTSDRQQAQLANVLSPFGQVMKTPIGRTILEKGRDFLSRNIGGITAIGGTGAMLADIYEQNGLCSSNKRSSPYSVSKDGCISVTRKQQSMLKNLVMTMGMDGASDITGLAPQQIGLLIIKKFPPRSRGISGASMKTTRRTIRQLTRYAEDLDQFCKRPTPRKRRK